MAFKGLSRFLLLFLKLRLVIESGVWLGCHPWQSAREGSRQALHRRVDYVRSAPRSR